MPGYDFLWVRMYRSFAGESEKPGVGGSLSICLIASGAGLYCAKHVDVASTSAKTRHFFVTAIAYYAQPSRRGNERSEVKVNWFTAKPGRSLFTKCCLPPSWLSLCRPTPHPLFTPISTQEGATG